MHQKKINKDIKFALKTLATLIVGFSILLVRNNHDIKMHNSEDIKNIDIKDIVKHAGPTDPKKEFQMLCVEYILTCVRVNFEGDFDYAEKYSYFKPIAQFATLLDSQYPQNSFSNTIKEITLKKANGERRGYATKDYIEINLYDIGSAEEFSEIFAHEAGHVLDLGMIKGSSKEKDKNYTEFNKAIFAKDDPSILFYKLSRANERVRRDTANQKHFCSRYGMTDPFEDLAECTNLYLHHNDSFQKMTDNNTILKKKYDFIDKIFHQNYLNDDPTTTQKIEKNPERRPRDTTKL